MPAGRLSFDRFVRPLMIGGVALATAAGLTGCANNEADELAIEQLRSENEELRSREAQLQAALSDTEARTIALQDERERLLSELESARTRPAPNAATGFEGIEGAQVTRRGGDIVVDVAGDVLFSSGSVTLRNEAKRTLNQIASRIQSTYAGSEIRIAGHTDSDPIRKSKWGTNERLSAERALAVENYLAERGVDKDRMHIAGYGPAKPRGTKAQSRRVEIVILGG